MDIEAESGSREVEDLPTLSRAEIMASNPFLRWLCDRIGLESSREVLNLIGLMVVPLLLFSYVTLSEGRFRWGSLARVDPELGQTIPGMSFLGDSMVWPFFILVPLMLLLLKRAAAKVGRFLDEVRGILHPEFISSHRADYARLVDQARRSLAARGWWWRSAWLLALTCSIAVYSYNFLVSTFPFPKEYEWLHPYKTDRYFDHHALRGPFELVFRTPAGEGAWVVRSPTEVEIHRPDGPGSWVVGTPFDVEIRGPHGWSKWTIERIEHRNLVPIKDKRVNISKWDTDPQGAPVSWLLARAWTVFSYGIIPFVLMKVINFMGVLYTFCHKLTHMTDSWARPGPDALVIKPLAPDNAGGLSSLSEAALSFTYVLVPCLLMVIAAFFKEASTPSAANYLLVFLFFPLMLSTFLIPITSVHSAMKRAKERYLHRISRQFSLLNDQLFQDVLNKGSPIKGELVELEKTAEALKKLYADVEKLPVWPLELATLHRLLATFSIPPIIWVLKEIAQKLGGG